MRSFRFTYTWKGVEYSPSAGEWSTFPCGKIRMAARLQPNHCFLDSIEHPAAVFRRIEHRAFFAETLVSFQPEDSQQWAGLACYYDTRHWYYIYRGWRPGSGSIIGLCGKGIRGSNRIEALGEFAFNSTDDVEFRVSCEQMHLQFSFRPSGTENWRSVGPLQDASVLTDEYVESEDPIPNFGFTGAFVGVGSVGYDWSWSSRRFRFF